MFSLVSVPPAVVLRSVLLCFYASVLWLRYDFWSPHLSKGGDDVVSLWDKESRSRTLFTSKGDSWIQRCLCASRSPRFGTTGPLPHSATTGHLGIREHNLSGPTAMLLRGPQISADLITRICHLVHLCCRNLWGSFPGSHAVHLKEGPGQFCLGFSFCCKSDNKAHLYLSVAFGPGACVCMCVCKDMYTYMCGYTYSWPLNSPGIRGVDAHTVKKSEYNIWLPRNLTYK